MSRRMRRSQVEMEGGELVPPQVPAIEEGHQEMLKKSHIKVDSRYFAIDPNLDFEASTILCEDRVYSSDQTPDPTQPLTWTIQPQFNVFRALSESRFVFLLDVIPSTTRSIQTIPKPYWSALFVNNFVVNINNVACNDQHSRTAQYAHFIKTVMLEGNLSTQYILNPVTEVNPATSAVIPSSQMYGSAGDDCRTLSEGILHTDYWAGLDELTSYNNQVMATVAGFAGLVGSTSDASPSLLVSPIYPSNICEVEGLTENSGNVSIELTYRPRDGIWQQPKLLPPGVNLNFVMNLSTIGTWASGYVQTGVVVDASASMPFFGVNPDSLTVASTYTISRAYYYERQYTITQTGLKAYQSLIMRQPLYYTCLTSNTLLFPVSASQQSVQLTNVFSGRLPNIVVVALLNQSANQLATVNQASPLPAGAVGNSHQFLTYSPLPGRDRSYTSANGNLTSADCISSCVLTVNGRVYPHLWSSNMLPRSNRDLSQWYEQYRQCALISRVDGRGDGGSNNNLDLAYKYDCPLLSFGEFKANFTLLCFNIRRNGTLVNRSGDKEVGGLDILVNINGTSHPNAQLMVVGLNTDSLMTITDGGSTTSFVF